jgi:hypothetical protein
VAAAFDNAERGFNAVANTTLSTAAFLVGGSNRVLYAFVASGAGTPVDPSTVKWNTTESLSKLSITLNEGSNGKFSVWRLIAPSAVSSTVDVVWPSNQDERLVIGVSTKDAHQTAPEGTIATATGTDTAPTVNATTVSGDLVLDGVFFLDIAGFSRTLTQGGSQTLRKKIDGADIVFEGEGSSTATAASSSTTMSWTISGVVTAWGIFAFSVNAAPAAPAAGPPQLGRNIYVMP